MKGKCVAALATFVPSMAWTVVLDVRRSGDAFVLSTLEAGALLS